MARHDEDEVQVQQPMNDETSFLPFGKDEMEILLSRNVVHACFTYKSKVKVKHL